MFSQEEHLDNLTRHINLVRDNCLLLGKRIIASGQDDFGRLLIARGYVHDQSKFFGIEWDYLHVGPEVSSEDLERAVKQHTRTNDHHPEFHGHLSNMPEIAVAEMVCDWYARSQEFGTNLCEWIRDQASTRYEFDKAMRQRDWIDRYTKLLLRSSFK